MDKIDRNSAVPVYQQIASDILSRISAGEWPIGCQISSELCFCEEYNSSRVTLRQALAKLEYEGFIEKQRGKGTFVKAKPGIVVQDLFIPQVGVRRKSDIVSANIRIAVAKKTNPIVLKFLRIDEKTSVVSLIRDFVQHGRIIGINHAWFPLHKVPGITEQPLENNSVTETLQQRYHINFSSIDNFIESISMDGETAHILNASLMSPALKISSVYFDEEGIPAEYSETIWNGRDTQFHISLSSK